MAKILFKRDMTPNSDRSELNAPANTDIDIIKNTVFKSKSCAVFISTLNMIPAPIILAI